MRRGMMKGGMVARALCVAAAASPGASPAPPAAPSQSPQCPAGADVFFLVG
eukprot:gene33598-42156_t